LSNFSDFLLECCGKFLVKRYRVKPYLQGVLKEEFKMGICPKCGQLIIVRTRLCKKENGTLKTYTEKLCNQHADFYLIGLDKTEIFNTKIETGSKSLANWFFGRNNRRYDLNKKARGRVISPNIWEEKSLITA